MVLLDALCAINLAASAVVNGMCCCYQLNQGKKQRKEQQTDLQNAFRKEFDLHTRPEMVLKRDQLVKAYYNSNSKNDGNGKDNGNGNGNGNGKVNGDSNDNDNEDEDEPLSLRKSLEHHFRAFYNTNGEDARFVSLSPDERRRTRGLPRDALAQAHNQNDDDSNTGQTPTIMAPPTNTKHTQNHAATATVTTTTNIVAELETGTGTMDAEYGSRDQESAMEEGYGDGDRAETEPLTLARTFSSTRIVMELKQQLVLLAAQSKNPFRSNGSLLSSSSSSLPSSSSSLSSSPSLPSKSKSKSKSKSSRVFDSKRNEKTLFHDAISLSLFDDDDDETYTSLAAISDGSLEEICIE